MVLSQRVDGVVLVSCPDSTTRDGLRQFKQTMMGVNARVTGCIINKVDITRRLGAYSYHHQSGLSGNDYSNRENGAP